MKIKIIYSLVIALLFPAMSHAHKDRIIRLIDGELNGLPAQYQPAAFSYQDKKLTSGKKTVVIPESVWQKFNDTRHKPLEFSASWYHSMSSLPPYISIKNPDFSLLLSLDTLKIINGPPSDTLTSDQFALWDAAIKDIPDQ